jgi:hypothetical protein
MHGDAFATAGHAIAVHAGVFAAPPASDVIEPLLPAAYATQIVTQHDADSS